MEFPASPCLETYSICTLYLPCSRLVEHGDDFLVDASNAVVGVVLLRTRQLILVSASFRRYRFCRCLEYSLSIQFSPPDSPIHSSNPAEVWDESIQETIPTITGDASAPLELAEQSWCYLDFHIPKHSKKNQNHNATRSYFPHGGSGA